MFCRYFHSIACHAALKFRIVSLRSLNTEQHERLFQQAKGISRDTTNHHVEHVIPNIIQRLQFEVSSSSIKDQESEISALGKAVGPMTNSFIPQEIMDKFSAHYQAHLERISDYLVPGPGIWWRRCLGGVEFLDGSTEPNYKETGPQLHHFRSKSTTDIELDLFEKWESICSSNTQLPATHIRCYNKQGSLQLILSSQN